MTANAGVLLCTEAVPRLRSAIPDAAKPIRAEDAAEQGSCFLFTPGALQGRAVSPDHPNPEIPWPDPDMNRHWIK